MSVKIKIPCCDWSAEHIAKVNHVDYPGTRIVIWYPSVEIAVAIGRPEISAAIGKMFDLPQVKGVIAGEHIFQRYFVLYVEEDAAPLEIEAQSTHQKA
jgi:hypothetical protein